MTEIQLSKWSSDEIKVFLDIYSNYEDLWDTNNENYGKRKSREESLSRLFCQLKTSGFKICSEETLRKKIKNLRDSYRNEVNKIKHSIKSGAGADTVYKPKLVWFDKADSIWRNMIFGRECSSNLDLPSMIQSSTDYDDYKIYNVKVEMDVVEDEEEVEEEDDENDSREIPGGPQTLVKHYSTMDSFSPIAGQLSHDYSVKASYQNFPTTARNKRPARPMVAQEPPKKTCKFKSTTKNVSSFQAAVSKLQEIAQVMTNASAEDQYDRFANHLAAQLRELPIRSFVILQEKIQSLITRERLDNLSTPQSSPAPRTL